MNNNFPKPSSAIGWFLALRRNFPEWYVTSSRSQAHPYPWPARFNPANDSVFSYNEILIEGVSPARIFDVLISAKNWSNFYPNAEAVEIPNGEKLFPGCEFQWKTFATKQQSKIELYEQDYALGWSAESPGTHAFHRWILEPKGNGTLVITEECQNGIMAWLDRFIMNPGLHAAHQLWLVGISSQFAVKKFAVCSEDSSQFTD